MNGPSSPKHGADNGASMMSLLTELQKKESLVEERHSHDSVRLSNLETMMEDQGRVLLAAVESLEVIQKELQMISLSSRMARSD
jgi:hypothetical protein